MLYVAGQISAFLVGAAALGAALGAIASWGGPVRLRGPLVLLVVAVMAGAASVWSSGQPGLGLEILSLLAGAYALGGVVGAAYAAVVRGMKRRPEAPRTQT